MGVRRSRQKSAQAERLDESTTFAYAARCGILNATSRNLHLFRDLTSGQVALPGYRAAGFITRERKVNYMSSNKQHRDFVALDADILQTHLSVLAEAMDKEKFELVVRALQARLGLAVLPLCMSSRGFRLT